MPRVGCEVDCASEDIEHAAIDVLPLQDAEICVELFRIFPFEFIGRTKSEGIQILGTALPDAGKTLQVAEGGFAHRCHKKDYTPLYEVPGAGNEPPEIKRAIRRRGREGAPRHGTSLLPLLHADDPCR